MDLAFASFLLKVISGLSTAGFAILGLGTKARDENHALTAAGRVALGGLLVSLAISLVTQAVDYRLFAKSAEKQRDQYRDELQRAQNLIKAVQRGLYPFRSATVQLKLRLPRGNEVLDAYVNRVLSTVKTYASCETFPEGLSCAGEPASPDGVNIASTSALFPDAESSIFKILQSLFIDVDLFRREDSGYVYLGKAHVNWRSSDLMRLAVLSIPLKNNPTSFYGRIGLIFNRMTIDDHILVNSGVQSLSDFIPGAVLLVPGVKDADPCKSLAPLECGRLLKDIPEGIYAEHFMMSFPFPKAIRVGFSGEKRCSQPPQAVGLALPDDIDLLDVSGNITGQEPPAVPCEWH